VHVDGLAKKVGWPIAFIVRPVFVFIVSGIFILLMRSCERGLADGTDNGLTFQLSGMRMMMANREHTEKSWNAVLKKLRS
jgi:hypothetical protein